MAVNPQIKTLELRPPKAPNLPIAPVEYRQLYQDQVLNALRLYFNQIDNFAQPFSSNTGGAFLKFPNGAFSQDGFTTLTNAIPNSSSTAAIVVASTANFASAGTLLIGKELISYTGKTATSFTGITRSQYGSSGAAHSAGVYVTEAQAVPSATTALQVPFDTTDVSNQIALDPADNTKIVFAVAGYYNIQFSAQLLNPKSSIDNVSFWFRKNTNDIPNTAGVSTVPTGPSANLGATLTAWNIVIPVNAGDNIQLMMSSVSGDTVIGTYPPGTAPVSPASPAVILTATFVSALY